MSASFESRDMTLVEIGAKRIETRSWQTAYRGPLAIHVAKKWSRELEAICFQPLFLRALRQNEGNADAAMIRRVRAVQGCVVAIARLVKVVPTQVVTFAHESKAPLKVLGSDMTPTFNEVVSDAEIAFGDYGSGRYAWLLSDVRPLPTPIPFRGAQGLFDIPDSLVQGAAA